MGQAGAAAVNDVGLSWGAEATRTLWQAPVGFALNAMLGVAIGALLRSQVVAITVALAVFLGYVVTACVAAGVHLTRGDV